MAIVGSVESQYYKVVIYITWNGVTYMYIMVINIMVLNVIKCFPRNGKGQYMCGSDSDSSLRIWILVLKKGDVHIYMKLKRGSERECMTDEGEEGVSKWFGRKWEEPPSLRRRHLEFS